MGRVPFGLPAGRCVRPGGNNEVLLFVLGRLEGPAVVDRADKLPASPMAVLRRRAKGGYDVGYIEWPVILRVDVPAMLISIPAREVLIYLSGGNCERIAFR